MSQDPPSRSDQALHHFPVSMRVQFPTGVATKAIRGKKFLLNAVDQLVDDFNGRRTRKTSSPPGNVWCHRQIRSTP